MEINHALLEFFKKEHAVLSAIFEREFKLAQISKNWSPLLSFCKLQFENNHHEKEEKFIFEAVKNNSKIKSGGPLCTYFFDGHMMNPSLRRAIEVVKNQTGMTQEPSWTSQMRDIRDKNLPLAIPGEDHEAGRIILRGVEPLLHLEPTEHTHAKIETLFKTYIEIQKVHFDREENCFFRMCSDLIPPQKWNQIYFEMSNHYTEICDSI